ncbi:Hypothetical protein FKW44_008921 [Caligus rogercresseyi]|uniref:Uncharacterized protein n=1 Tax=Caligus rogercresseyi TaxID=217165 RepID=A0A7T8HEK3_CALRO|nr:Hypothetical protein FKW44_008921 [Caligus rogercresseyi]
MSDTLLMKSGVLALWSLLEGLKALSTTARGSLVSFSCCLSSATLLLSIRAAQRPGCC